MHRIRLELTRRALTLRVELAPESPPAVVETHSGEITLATGPGLAKTRPSNVIPLLRKVGAR
jgi:hypothetical protein